MPVSSFPFPLLQYVIQREGLYFCANTSIGGWTTKDRCGLDYCRVKLPLRNLFRGKKGKRRGGEEGEEYMKMRHQSCSSSAG